MNFKELYTLISEKRVVDGKQEFIPIKLPYSYDGLEPYIDQETMNLHYNKHYKGYIKKLNDAINVNIDLETLVRRSAKRNRDRKSTRLNSSHPSRYRMPSSA